MTPSEFKAWFDGFTEALDGTPSKEQWARIKKRVSEIDGRPVTERVFVDRYISHYWPQFVHQNWQAPYPSFPTIWCSSGAQRNADNSLQQYQAANLAVTGGSHHNSFDSHHAMLALGRAEAVSIS